jgi:hypothetical protein
MPDLPVSTPDEGRFCACGATLQWVGGVRACPWCGEEPEAEAEADPEAPTPQVER